MNKAVWAMLMLLWLFGVGDRLSAEPNLSTDKSRYRSNESIQVSYSAAPGVARDWICIVPFGTAETNGGDYQYLPTGASSGTLVFSPRYPGKYEVRAYYNYHANGYHVSHRTLLTVSDDPSAKDIGRKYADAGQKRKGAQEDLLVYAGKDAYQDNETIQVYFSGSAGNNSDWVSIVPLGTPDTYAGTYQYVPVGMERGSLVFSPQVPGQYEARVYYNYRRNGYVVSARYPFTVQPPAVASPGQGKTKTGRKKKN